MQADHSKYNDLAAFHLKQNENGFALNQYPYKKDSKCTALKQGHCLNF